jgi:CxC5 like cysteine cluster associated with KDZ transposases
VPDAGQDNAGRLYLNSAKYLKVGQSLWVDHLFARPVLNGTYSFHASVSAYAEFWNNSFWMAQDTNSQKVSHHQIWHTFIQESLCLVATASNTSLILPDNSDIKSVMHHAFDILGERGIITPGHTHSCSECTHPYKATADVITGDDPAALLGQDEN